MIEKIRETPKSNQKLSTQFKEHWRERATSNADIESSSLLIFMEEDVGWFQISMEDILAVQINQSFQHPASNVGQDPFRHEL